MSHELEACMQSVTGRCELLVSVSDSCSPSWVQPRAAETPDRRCALRIKVPETAGDAGALAAAVE